MHAVAISIERFLDEHQLGFVECALLDAFGKMLGRSDMLFAPCKLAEMTARDFVCTQVSGGSFTFRRVQSDFALF